MPRKSEKVETALCNKGFRLKKGKHKFFIYYTTGKIKSRIQTMFSHSAREIPRHNMRQMADQCKISLDDFHELVDCTLDQVGYEAKLIAANVPL